MPVNMIRDKRANGRLGADAALPASQIAATVDPGDHAMLRQLAIKERCPAMRRFLISFAAGW
jgi:hypothetical protein